MTRSKLRLKYIYLLTKEYYDNNNRDCYGSGLDIGLGRRAVFLGNAQMRSPGLDSNNIYYIHHILTT